MSFGSFWGSDETDEYFQKILPRYLPDEAVGANGTIRIVPTTILPLEIPPPTIANQTLTIINNDPTRGSVVVDTNASYPLPTQASPNSFFSAYGTTPIKIANDNTGYLVYGRIWDKDVSPNTYTGVVYLYNPITDIFQLLITTLALSTADGGAGFIGCIAPLVPLTTGEALDNASYVMVGNFSQITLLNPATGGFISTTNINQVVVLNSNLIPANYTITSVGFGATDYWRTSPNWCIGRPSASNANFQFIVGGATTNNPILIINTAGTQFYGFAIYNTNVGGGIASIVPATLGDATSGLYADITLPIPTNANVESGVWTTNNQLALSGNFGNGLIGATTYLSSYITLITFGAGTAGVSLYTPYLWMNSWTEYYAGDLPDSTFMSGLRYVKDPQDGLLTVMGNVIQYPSKDVLPYMLIQDDFQGVPINLAHQPFFQDPAGQKFITILAVSDTQYMLGYYSNVGGGVLSALGEIYGCDNDTYAFKRVSTSSNGKAVVEWYYNSNADPTAKPLTIFGFDNFTFTTSVPSGVSFSAVCSEDFGINVNFVASVEQPIPAPLSYAIIENQFAEADGETLGLVIHQTNATFTCIGDTVGNKWDLVGYTGDITFEP